MSFGMLGTHSKPVTRQLVTVLITGQN